MEAITYYHRDGEHFGVLALTVEELRTVSAALGFALDRDNFVDPGAQDIRNVVLQGIQTMMGRLGDPDGL